MEKQREAGRIFRERLNVDPDRKEKQLEKQRKTAKKYRERIKMDLDRHQDLLGKYRKKAKRKATDTAKTETVRTPTIGRRAH